MIYNYMKIECDSSSENSCLQTGSTIERRKKKPIKASVQVDIGTQNKVHEIKNQMRSYGYHLNVQTHFVHFHKVSSQISNS